MPDRELRLAAPFRATARQQELANAWHSGAPEVLACGAIRSGKTQAAARLLVDTALAIPCTYLVARLTYRELHDTTQRAMLDGDGSLPPLIPPAAIRRYRAADNEVELIGGSRILFRSLDDPSKLLNLTLGGILIDQVEELGEGPAGERIYDTLLGRLSDPRGTRQLMCVANPAATTHWLYRRFVDPRTRSPRARYVHFGLEDNPHLPPAYVEDMHATRETRPHWYRTYVLGEWGAIEGAAYEEWDARVHVVPTLERLPADWPRLEGMDHGAANPTAWLLAATDYDGNVLVWDEYYETGLVSQHAAEILRRRAMSWWQRDERGALVPAPCYADPTIRNRYGLSDPTGRELSVELEYTDHGIALSPGQNDRRAGYSRVLELLHPDPARPFPDWHPRRGQLGSPRLFVSQRCERLCEQLLAAPVKQEGRDALDIVDPGWEGQHGHAHAALRYLVMGRVPAPPRPVVDERSLREEYAQRAAREWQSPKEVLVYA